MQLYKLLNTKTDVFEGQQASFYPAEAATANYYLRLNDEPYLWVEAS